MRVNWETYVRKVVPYTPGEQPKDRGIIKLNTNENPYPPCPGVYQALSQMDVGNLRKYPDPTVHDLVAALAAQYGLKEEQVFVGVGSDDVPAMCFLTFFNSGKPILFPDITYSFYDVWASMLRIPYEQIPLDDHFRIRPEDYCRENGGVVIANPNAPTGVLLPAREVEKILQANRDQIVIVDEAYVDFGGESVLGLVGEYDNLIVVQTFSKSRSLAGMRIGCAFADEKLIRYLNDVKYSFNSYTMNTPSILAGVAAVEDEAYFAQTRDRIIQTRERVKTCLRELGFSFEDSKTNFIFATHETIPAKELFEYLKTQRIFVRYFSLPRISNYLRISIGTDEEMDRLLAVLREYISGVAGRSL